MSAYWHGNLRNTETDVFIDATLLVLSVCVYIPQITRLRNDAFTGGISAYYILFNIFFSNAQLSEILLFVAYAWPIDSRPVLQQLDDGSLKGLQAFGGILGLLQIFVQWSCSISVLISFADGSQAGRLSGRSIPTIAFLHAAVALFPVVATCFPRPGDHDMATGILIALISMSNRVVAPCFVVLQFYVQFREMRNQNGDPGAFSLLSVCLQMPVLAMVGFRWFLRLGHPPWGYIPPPLAPIWLWYEWGFPAVNYVLHAVGCAVLLVCYYFAVRGATDCGHSENRTPFFT